MKTAGEVIHGMAGGLPVAPLIEDLIQCPECGGPMKMSFNPDVAADFPALAQWSWLVVCNECADFRTAFRNQSDILGRQVWRYRCVCLDACRKGLKPEEEKAKLEDARKELQPGITKTVQIIAAILAKRSGRVLEISDPWVQRFMDIFVTRESYGQADYCWVDMEDKTQILLAEMRRHYGVAIINHWKRAKLSEQDVPD